MKWNINIKLERPDEFKKEDESWFDEDHMKTEFTVWLEDLDYTVTDVKILSECASQDLEPSGKQRSKRQDTNHIGALAQPEADKDIARIQTSINDLNKAEEKADAEQNEIDKNIKLNRELYLQNQKANPDDTI